MTMLAGALVLSGCRNKTEEQPQELTAEQKPQVFCDYVYLVDRENGQVLWDQGSEERIYPASLTKMMTGIVALENIDDLNDTFLFTEEVVAGLKEAGANRAGFWVGDEPTLLDLVYGDILPSGAECSRALGYYLTGSEEGLVDLMNAKAAELGMHDTHFVNTTGLHDDNHYSTCRDMARLLDYCLQNEQFRKIITTYEYTAVPTENYPEGLKMRNAVLMYVNQEDPPYENFEIPGFIGGKSGYTIEGQYTLASEAVINGMDLILVNCHGYVEPHYPASIDDAATIFNYIRDTWGRQTLWQKGDLFTTLRIRNTVNGQLDLHHRHTLVMDLPLNDTHIVSDTGKTADAPLSAGQYLGRAQVYAFDRLMAEERFYATSSFAATRSGKLWTFGYELAAAWGVPLAVLLVLLVILLSVRLRRRRRSE